MIIAIDGPAAAGKGSLARLLAARLDLDHLDTGRLYRAVGLLVLEQCGDPADAVTATRCAGLVRASSLTDPRLGSEMAARAAQIVSRWPGVRRALLDWQRNFATSPPGGRGAVLDGRDIGTVVCPGADVKIFLTATAACRARRRWKEAGIRGEKTDEASILADLLDRDRSDRERAASPLVAAPDAFCIDSTGLTPDEVLEMALREVTQKRTTPLHPPG